MTNETTSFSLNLSPSSDPIPPSETRVDKCVDLISQLPLELVMSNILPKIFGHGLTVIDLGQPCDFLDVCSTWRERIAQLDMNVILFLIRSKTTMTELAYMRLRAIAPYAKSLFISVLSMEFASTLFAECSQFPLLTRLHVTCKASRSHDLCDLTIGTFLDTGSQETMHVLLRGMPALMHLDISHVDRHDAIFRLFELLDHCPTLVHLKVSKPLSTAVQANTHKSYPNLVHLEWMNGNSLETYIHHFPNLTILQVSNPPSLAALNIIYQGCPKLQQLHISRSYNILDLIDVNMKKRDEQGLVLLWIEAFLVNGDYLQQLMIQYGNTVEECILQGYLRVNNTVNQNLEFKRLKSLTYRSHGSSGCSPSIEWVINHSLNLESYSNSRGPVTGPCLRTLMHRPLRRIELECINSPQNYEYEFIQHHVKLGVESHLQELKCHIHGCTKDSLWIHSISGLKQLKSLELHVGYDLIKSGRDGENIDVHALARLSINLSQGCPSLEKITVLTRLGPSKEWILPLSNHASLKHLVIGASTVPNDTLVELERFRSLELLHLKLGTYDPEAMEHLKRKLCNLIVSRN
ncbi:hypothetical protein K492DRAFT_211916 [Lichtheimia hyalospora FSU 10163]|nr:hypothetical protein K492DRAFT_211916 [Lichtheimia hyalospora FSU 10163]